MKKTANYIFLIVGIFLIAGTSLHAQKECGTVLKGNAIARYSQYAEAARQQQQRVQVSKYHVRLFFHDFISDDGTDSAWGYNEIITEFNQASGFFNQYNICLVLAGIDFPRNTAFMDSYVAGDFPSTAVITHSDAIDITLHKGLIDGDDGQALNGIAYTIPGKFLSLSRGALGQRSFGHEVGHCLGLIHTFETLYCLECPDGSNNTTCGDKIADTRATPDDDDYMGDNTNASCVYTGNRTINCNGGTRTYNPEVVNLMCYGRRECRSVFTPNQLTLIGFTLENNSSMQTVWFDTPGSLVIAPPSGTMIINTDKYYAGSSVQVGNSATTFNVLIGGNNSQQKIVSPTSITIKPGVKLLQPNDARGRVWIKAGDYCQE